MKFAIGGESHEMKIDSWQRSNVSPSIELTVERTMIKTQHCPNCEATEQKLHDFRQEVSDAVVKAIDHIKDGRSASAAGAIGAFVIPKPKPDPLVEVMKQAGWADAVIESCAPSLSAALDARGLEIREKNDDQ